MERISWKATLGTSNAYDDAMAPMTGQASGCRRALNSFNFDLFSHRLTCGYCNLCQNMGQVCSVGVMRPVVCALILCQWQKPTDPPCQTEGEFIGLVQGDQVRKTRAMTTKLTRSHSCVTACALQSCLGKNTYRPEKCDDYVRKLYKCCWEMYERTDGKGESTACPLQNVTRRWLKQHGEDVE